MTITKHGIMRFKQRQKIKNSAEMERKATCAVQRGKLQKFSSSDDINCYLFDGFYYLVSSNNERLVTVFRPNKARSKDRKLVLENIRIKELMNESNDSLAYI